MTNSVSGALFGINISVRELIYLLDNEELKNTIYDKKGEKNMTNEKIAQIARDIQNYKEAIENAEGALAEAERELDEELSHAYSE